MPIMNTRFVLQGITFIWDENKARENPLHHDGITFEQATEAFFDPFLKVVDGPRSWHRPLRSMSLQKTQRLDITKG
jgi:uncharacterized DUF497 family protein